MPVHHEPLPESVPTVVFDIDLGRTTQFIDFNYTAFNDMAVENGVTPETIEDYKINFLGTPTKQMMRSLYRGGVLGGFYDSKKREAVIAPPKYQLAPRLNELADMAEDFGLEHTSQVASKTAEYRLNEIAIHETFHWMGPNQKSQHRDYFNKLYAKHLGAAATGSAVGYAAEGIIGQRGLSGLVGLAVFFGLKKGIMNGIKRKYPAYNDLPWEAEAYAFSNERRDNTQLVELQFRPGEALDWFYEERDEEQQGELFDPTPYRVE